MQTEKAITLTILMPCLNEARTIGTCISKAQIYLARQDFRGEIVVADNGSSDGSIEIAKSLGARVVAVQERGYGNALLAGIKAAHGEFVIMGDSDDSYDFESLDAFIDKLQSGYHLVIGNRYDGGIKAGAMRPLHRYFGNPLLTAIGRLLYKSPVNDFYCGLRGFHREAILQLGLSSIGMEFALEMIIRSTIGHLRIAEVPTMLHQDGRRRLSHLRTWHDGWRSLRLYLLLSPEGLFLYPGLALTLLSGLTSLVLFFTDIKVGSIVFAQHTLIMTCALTVIGIEAVFFWTFAKSIAIQKRLLFTDPVFRAVRNLFNPERCLVIGGLLVTVGITVACYALFYWYRLSFGPVAGDTLIRFVCAASVLMSVGFQLIFAAFFMLLIDHQSGQLEPSVGSEQAETRATKVTTPVVR